MSVTVAYQGKTTLLPITVTDPNTVHTPTATPPAGAIPANQAVSLSTTTEGAVIYYTTNGDAPTVTSTPYTAAFTLPYSSTTVMVKAIAVKEGMTNSAVLTAVYTLTTADTTAPANVTGLTRTAGNTQVTLSWTDPVDADLNHIEITWTGGLGGTGGPVTVPKSTEENRANSTTITGLTNETEYTFTVKAVDATGNESVGETATATPDSPIPTDTTPPAEVTGLSADPSNEQVTLSWIDPEDDDLDHIEITWTAGSGGTGEPVTVEKSTAGDRANSITITGLTNETEYTFTVKSMDNTGNKSTGVTITATPADAGGAADFIITTTEEWTDALAQIKAATDGTELNPKVYTLTIVGNVSVPGVTSDSSSITGNNKTVRLTGMGTLLLSSEGSMFRTGSSSQTLIIDGPALQGRTDNIVPVVYIVSGGAAELHNGKISGNTAAASYSSYGGGVYIGDNGTFIMSGGEISGNTAAAALYPSETYGGGVYIGGGGEFTMSGSAVIRNNTASSYSSYGGGVYIGASGTFTMEGGEISGNTADASSYSSYGGGVYIGGGGEFTMSGSAVISGNTATSSSSTFYSYSYGGGVYIGASGTFNM
jgi:hypothetical protein